MNDKPNENQDKPVLTPLSEIDNVSNITPPSKPEEKKEVEIPTPPVKKSKGRKALIFFLLNIIVFLIVGIYAINVQMQQKIKQLNYNCTPITASKEKQELDLKSTIVKSLYAKFATTVREDVVQPEFNDDMKLYLAYRQILEKDKYDSTCSQFSVTAMEPYVCKVSGNAFTPKAFKEETLKQKLKELYGENVSISLKNIQLGNTCLVGYQYIPARGEFVEGYCNQIPSAASMGATKELIKATSTGNTITLTEKVSYYTKNGSSLPSTLKSGYYQYVFRLDMNYNFVLVERNYSEDA